MTRRKSMAWIADYGRHINRRHNMSIAIDDAFRAVLMFHDPGEWTAERRAEWKRITGSDEATTKVLCDHIRKVLQ
jgi:hypothetical protein